MAESDFKRDNDNLRPRDLKFLQIPYNAGIDHVKKALRCITVPHPNPQLEIARPRIERDLKQALKAMEAAKPVAIEDGKIITKLVMDGRE